MKKILTLLLIMLPMTGVAMENKIKFDDKTYNLSVNTTNGYNYYLKGENSDNWHSKISIKELGANSNPTKLSAELAHQIQSENPSASVLVYPDAGMVGYLLPNKHFYEYNTVSFQKNREFTYSKRFYISEFDSKETARQNAINFAEKNNKKYMELTNREAQKIKR